MKSFLPPTPNQSEGKLIGPTASPASVADEAKLRGLQLLVGTLRQMGGQDRISTPQDPPFEFFVAK